MGWQPPIETMTGCANWNIEWGECGQCTYCTAKAARQDTHDAFRRLEGRIDELAEQIAKLIEKQSAQPQSSELRNGMKGEGM